MNDKIKNRCTTITVFAYALILLYAALSKWLEGDNFLAQLGQSPVINGFANILVWAVPAAEIAIVIMLFVTKTKKLGLYAGLSLMVMFTAYIFIILNYSTYVPCSCGGVLEDMSWTQHFIFNITLIVMAVITLIIMSNKRKKEVLIITGTTILSIMFMVVVNNRSQNQMRFHNQQQRLFPPHLADRLNKFDLKYNSYYIAGESNGKIYLGNYTAPFVVTAIDSSLTNATVYKIKIASPPLKMNIPRVAVNKGKFFFYEGSVPYIYQGNIEDWRASLLTNEGWSFSQLVPLNNHLVIRYNQPGTGNHVIGTFNLQTRKPAYRSDMLPNVANQIFANDGKLSGDQTNDSFTYTFVYKNRYTLGFLENDKTKQGNTIDTISDQKIEIVDINNNKSRTFKKMPIMVNKMADTDDDFILIASSIIGQNEPKEMWDVATIVDVYHSETSAYLSSMYLDDIDNKKIHAFKVVGNTIYVLAGNKIVRFKFRKEMLPH